MFGQKFSFGIYLSVLIDRWGPHVLCKCHTSHKISFPEVFFAVLQNNFGNRVNHSCYCDVVLLKDFNVVLY